MKNIELQILLTAYPDDIEVIVEVHSDYLPLEEKGIEIVRGVEKGGWIMRSHRTMTEENKKKESVFLSLGGC